MKRYRVIYSTYRAGEFREFSAADDAAAVEQAEAGAYGARIVALTEETGPTTARTVEVAR